MLKHSAGLLPYRLVNHKLEVFLVHPGGPFWATKDTGAWSIPKGEYERFENPKSAAKREFIEETGLKVPPSKWLTLGEVQYSNKIVKAWAIEAELDTKKIKSNFFEIKWPPNSGKVSKFPEIDRAKWFEFDLAKQKINKGQIPFLENLKKIIET